MEAFCKNILNYRLANDMTRQEFADRLTENLSGKGEKAKVYSSNDIWTYDGRGSMPRQGGVLVAIADVIGKPLEHLLDREFGLDELKSSVLASAKTESAACKREDWDIKKLDELPEEEVDFILDLVSAGVSQEGNCWQSYFDIGLRYNSGKTVTATMYYGFEYEKERVLEWKWQEYGDVIQRYDDECYILENKLDEEIFAKLDAMGLANIYCCSKCDLDEICDERYEGIKDYFVVRVDFKQSILYPNTPWGANCGSFRR